MKVIIEDFVLNAKVTLEGEKAEEIIKVLDSQKEEKVDSGEIDKIEKAHLEFRELIERKQMFEIEDIVVLASGRIGVVTKITSSGQVVVHVAENEFYSYDIEFLHRTNRIKHFDFDKYCKK